MTKTVHFKLDWLFLFLILMPTFYLSGHELRTVQMNFFQLSIIFLVGMFHVNRYFGWLLLWMTFQYVFYKDIPDRTHLLTNVFFASVLYHFISKYAVISKKYLWVIYGILILNVLWLPLQHFQIDPIFMPTKGNRIMSEMTGFFALPAFLGNYAAVVLPLGFILNIWLFPACLVGLFFGKSTFSVMAAFISALFYFWFKKRIVFWVFLILGSLASSFYIIKYDMPEGEFNRRLKAWNLILKVAFTKQFTGFGLGTYHEKFVFLETSPSLTNHFLINNTGLIGAIAFEAGQQNKPELQEYLKTVNPNQINQTEFENKVNSYGIGFHPWAEAHNEFIQLFFELGALGILIVIGYIMDIFRRFWRYRRDPIIVALASSFLAIILVSVGHFPFHVARLAGPFIVIMAFLDTALLRADKGSS